MTKKIPYFSLDMKSNEVIFKLIKLNYLLLR